LKLVYGLGKTLKAAYDFVRKRTANHKKKETHTLLFWRFRSIVFNYQRDRAENTAHECKVREMIKDALEWMEFTKFFQTWRQAERNKNIFDEDSFGKIDR